MLVNARAGNVIDDKRLAAKYRRMKAAGNCEILYLSRHELERFRIKRTTDRGTEVRFVRDQTSPLRNGDVLVDSEKSFIVVEQLPERIILATIKSGTRADKAAEVAALLAHAVGNKHRPIALKGRMISFPALADSELELFKQLTKPVSTYVRLSVHQAIFEPDNLGEVHDHPA
jgi:urease accessory protein